jgi:hypothetical protein
MPNPDMPSLITATLKTSAPRSLSLSLFFHPFLQYTLSVLGWSEHAGTEAIVL